jgi:NAD(P)-dependent dehydrogenase (short-subunit alcohol dehydrogenase family)
MIRALDVSDDGQRRLVVDEANARWGAVDVLINNAGVAYRAVVEHVTEQDRMTQMDVNYRSPMELTRLVLPRMREQRWGRIMNLSSVGGMMAMPTMAVYSASKFALEGASEALWYEVRPWNICVSLIQPGFIRSDGFEKVRFTELSQASRGERPDPYSSHYHFMEGFIQGVMRRALATPDSVARTVLRQLARKRPPLRVPATLDARIFSLFRRLLPRGLYHWVLYRSLPGIDQWGPGDA